MYRLLRYNSLDQFFNFKTFQFSFQIVIRRVKYIIILFTILFSIKVGIAQNKPIVNKTDFFPFAVWYSGGTARATMLSSITPNSREEWKHDLQEIKSLGFNTVKTWVEWAHCEPREGEFHFENLKLLLDRKSVV